MDGCKVDLQFFFETFNRHDADGAVSFMTEDVVIETWDGNEVYGTRIVGRDAVRNAFANLWKTFPDAHWQIIRHTVVGSFGVSEWIFRGTGSDGRHIEVQGCDLLAMRDGKISAKRTFRKQRPPLPA